MLARYKVYVYEIELEIRSVVFCGGGGKPENPEKNKQPKLYLHMTVGPGSEPESNWWETSAIPPFPLPASSTSFPGPFPWFEGKGPGNEVAPS